MKILEYNNVGPPQVLNLTLLTLDFLFTPELPAQEKLPDEQSS